MLVIINTNKKFSKYQNELLSDQMLSRRIIISVLVALCTRYEGQIFKSKKKPMVQKVFIHLNSIEKLEVGNKFLVEHQSIKIKYEKNCLEE